MNEENDLGMVRYVPVTKRTGLDRELFQRYWRDLHGPMCAGIDGLHLYVQQHFGEMQPDLWLTDNRVSTKVQGADRFDGVAECSFRTVADFDRWRHAAEHLKDDEQNCFDGTYGHYSVDGRSRTTKADVDRAARGCLTVVALIRRKEGVADVRFREFIRDELVPIFTRSPHVLRCRYHLLEAFETHEDAWHAATVNHHLPTSQQFHAAVEFVVESRLALRRFFETDGYVASIQGQGELFGSVHPYPVCCNVVLVEAGGLTLDGRLGWSNAELARKIGAINVVDGH